MILPSLQNTDCTHKRVLMRVDFNVDIAALENMAENLKLSAVKESIDYVLSHPGATLTLVTHFGRPDGKPEAAYSVQPLLPFLENILERKVGFTADCLQSDVLSTTPLVLRENLRFYAEEETNDEAFAAKLATDFNLYVNEAFSVCHRKHASVVAITKCLPSVAGLRLQKEVQALSHAIEDPAHPAVAILGGAKIETKLPLIHVLENRYDTILVGGMIANEALDQQLSFSEKVILPLDFRGSERFDIGDETVERFLQVIAQAKTIIWNGPLGKFEEAPYDTGTTAIVRALAQSSAYVIAGGGESLTAIQKANVFSEIDLISTGGGAMLDFLAGEPLPGLDALQ